MLLIVGRWDVELILQDVYYDSCCLVEGYFADLFVLELKNNGEVVKLESFCCNDFHQFLEAFKLAGNGNHRLILTCLLKLEQKTSSPSF